MGSKYAPFLYSFFLKKNWQGAWRPFSSTVLPRTSSDCPRILQAPQTHKTATVDSLTTGTTWLTAAPGACIVLLVHHTTPMNFRTIIRTAVRSTLIQNGPQTCSDLVRGMGLNPSKHKGTVHALMVEMEREGILDATRADNGKRDLWFMVPTAIRKRDRLAAALIG
jgi:hypothetical protein